MQVYEEVTPQEIERQERELITQQRERTGVSVLLVQTAVCLLLLLAVLLLRACLPEAYGRIKEVYEGEMARSVLISHADFSGP